MLKQYTILSMLLAPVILIRSNHKVLEGTTISLHKTHCDTIVTDFAGTFQSLKD